MQIYECQEGMYVPMGSKPINAQVWVNASEMVILGDPEEVSAEFQEKHNCGDLGCGSIGHHVLVRFSLEQQGD